MLGITGLAKSIVVIFIAYAVIDGPNLAERILGIDAGLSSSVGRTMAVLGMARLGAGKMVGAAKSATGGAYKAARAFGTGKTGFERKQESKNASPAEKLGLFARGQTEKNESIKDKNGYKDTSFMNSGEQNNDKYSNANSSSSSNPNPNPNSYSEGKSYKDDKEHINTDFMQKGENRDENFDVKNTKGKFDLNNSISEKNASRKPINPEFSELAKKLSPSKNASVGERRDFNMQMNNIVKGNHRAIKPSKNSRAEYKKINYEKALKLEKAYHSVKKGAKKWAAQQSPK